MAMPETRTVPLDLVIFGGGAAGLWLLDEVRRRGHSAVLLEAHQLGSGQTIASQGIIHGGLKYTLSGLLTPSAQAIAEMPVIWRRCLGGEIEPNLSAVRLRSEYCYLWRSTSLSGMLAMAGARAGLRVTPEKISPAERPKALTACKGSVARLNEQVIEPASFLQVLADRNRDRLLKVDLESGLEFELDSENNVQFIRLINPQTGTPVDLQPRHVALCAGGGNEQLAISLRLTTIQTQRRPLHMVLVRGTVPELNGHCLDGTSTRVTITTSTDSSGRRVWQVGGQISEDGVDMTASDLIQHAQRELREILPGVDFATAQWSTYRVDRAEPATSSGIRPDDAVVHIRGNVFAAWPTKLALAPRLAERVLAECVAVHDTARADDVSAYFAKWPRPEVALPPWECQQQWTSADSDNPQSN